MAYSIKKMMAIIALAVTTTGAAQAGDYCSTSHDCCMEACQPECCCPESCGQFFAGVGLLYLRAYEGGLSCVCDGTTITDSTVDGRVISRLTGEGFDPDFQWNPGFRLGVGYEFADCGCDIGAYWTNYHSHSSGGRNDNELHWNLDFNVVDVLYSCEFACSPCFVVTPFGGVRWAGIDQKLRTHFFSTVDGTSFAGQGHSREDFSGVGPVFGVDGDWSIGCGFSLYGDVALAALYGKFHVRSHFTDAFSTGTNIDHLKRHFIACQPVLDAGFGVRWRTCLCNDKLLMVQLGLEQHRYFNFNQFGGYGDLVLDGVNLSVGIEY